MHILLTHHIPPYVALFGRVADSVHVVDNGFRGAVPERAGVFALRLRGGGFWRQARFLKSYVEREKIGVIYAQGVRDLFPYWLASQWLRTPSGGVAGPTEQEDSESSVGENPVGRVPPPGEAQLSPRFLARGLRSRIPILVTSHSSYSWRSQWKPLFLLVLVRLFGDGFIFLSGGLYRQWSPFCRRIGLPCWHVPNPVDVSRFSAKNPRSSRREEAHSSPGLVDQNQITSAAMVQESSARDPASGKPPSTREWRLGYVGVIHPMKGQRVLLEAAAQLHKRGFHLRAELVGDTLDAGYKRALDDFVVHAGLQSVVRFHGRMPYADIPVFLAGLDVYVCPSLSEMMPFHVLEAMAAELPVVGTRTWGVEDAVIPGQNGFLCAPGAADDLAEKLQALIRSPDAVAMGQASRQRAERCYDIPVVAEQYRQVLGDLFAPREA